MMYLKDEKHSYLLVFFSAFLVTLLFALYTNHAWEDWYITYRTSKNLALGHGLGYNAGVKLHTFTSPLGTLVPAALSYITGNTSDTLVLWLYRVVNAVLLGLSAVLLFKIARNLKLQVWPIIFLIAMFVFETKTVDFSINGMETAFMVSFLALSVYALITPHKWRVFLLGLSWGGLMWSRPDAFIYVIALTCGFFIFSPHVTSKPDRTEIFWLYVKAGLVASVIYIPWLIWTYSYYGSVLPQSIVAKGLTNNPSVRVVELLTDPAVFVCQNTLLF